MANIPVQVNQVGLATAEGHIRTHSVLIDRPEAKGGDDKGAMGGELLLVSLGGCFMSNLLAAIRAREAAISDVKIAINGNLEGTPPHFTAIEMRISANHDDRDLLEKLVTISERSCIVANTLKGSVDLSFVVE